MHAPSVACGFGAARASGRADVRDQETHTHNTHLLHRPCYDEPDPIVLSEACHASTVSGRPPDNLSVRPNRQRKLRHVDAPACCSKESEPG